LKHFGLVIDIQIIFDKVNLEGRGVKFASDGKKDHGGGTGLNTNLLCSPHNYAEYTRGLKL